MSLEHEFQREQFRALGEEPGEYAGYTLVLDPGDPRSGFLRQIPLLARGNRPVAIVERLREVQPGALTISREMVPEGETVPTRSPLEELGLMFRSLLLTTKAPGYLCPSWSSTTERPTAAAQAVAAGTTVTFPALYTGISRFAFRFVGLVQKVSDPLAAADSVWRIYVSGRLMETVGGIASSVTTPVPIFVLGKGEGRIDVTVQNVAAVAFDASPLLIGYRYPAPYDSASVFGTIGE